MTTNTGETTPRTYTRRKVLGMMGAAAASAGAGSLLAACGGGGGGATTMTLSSWNIPTDLASFRNLVDKYRKSHKDVRVKVQVTPDQNFDPWLNSRLAADKAPDILRIQYQNLGRYAQQQGLVDISDQLPGGYSDAFLDAYWATTQHNDGTYGIPHHTDGWGIFINNDMMAKIGVDPPTRLEDAWTWDEFIRIAREVKKLTGKYAFSWFHTGPTSGWRWLPVLYMHGGALLDDDLKTPVTEKPEAIEAIAWSQRWYAEGLIPQSNSIKGSQSDTASNLFNNEQVGMFVGSDFQMNLLREAMPESKWDMTYLFQDVRQTTNMGGNALAVTSSADDPETAADLVKFICNKENMAYFCSRGLFVPVRDDLMGERLQWKVRPELMVRFSEASKTLLPEMARLQALPEFGSITQVLSDQLDVCFHGQQSPQETGKNLAEGIRRVMR